MDLLGPESQLLDVETGVYAVERGMEVLETSVAPIETRQVWLETDMSYDQAEMLPIWPFAAGGRTHTPAVFISVRPQSIIRRQYGMQTHQLYALEALQRVQQFLDANGVTLGALSTTPARAQLDAAVTQLASETVGQSTAVRQASGQITRQRQLVDTLRQSYMQPIAKFARASLTGVPDMAALTNTGSRLQGNALVVAANSMATAAAPYVAQMTAAQFPPDELQQLSAAAAAVAGAVEDRASSKGQRVTATAGIKQSLSSGRQAVAMLDPVVTKMLVGNAGLLAGWRIAKRIAAKPGVVSATSVAPIGATLVGEANVGVASAAAVRVTAIPQSAEVPTAKVA